MEEDAAHLRQKDGRSRSVAFIAGAACASPARKWATPAQSSPEIAGGYASKRQALEAAGVTACRHAAIANCRDAVAAGLTPPRQQACREPISESLVGAENMQALRSSVSAAAALCPRIALSAIVIGMRHGEAHVPVLVFAIVFLLLCLLNSAIPLMPSLAPAYAPVKSVLVEVSTWGLLLAIRRAGTSVKTVIGLGWRHITTALGASAVIIVLLTGSPCCWRG